MALPEENRTTISTARSVFSTVQEFLAACKQPGVVDSGEPILPLRQGEYSLELDGEGALFECWGGSKVLRRRIRKVLRARRDRLELAVERFPRQSGKMTLVDCSSLSANVVEKAAERGVELTRFRGWCERQFPQWRIEQISGGADLEHSLSPRFPRALLRLGMRGLAVFAATDAASSGDALAFAIVWLNYARSHWPELAIGSLVLFVPREAAQASGLRFRWLSGDQLELRLFAFDPDGSAEEIRSRAWGNVDSSLILRSDGILPDERIREVFESVAAASDAEVVHDVNGTLHLEVHGLPVAVADGKVCKVGLNLQPSKECPTVDRLLRLVRKVQRIRRADSPAPDHAWYRAHPERWLESMVRNGISAIDPTIDPNTIRRQVGGYLGTDESRTDLIATDRAGNTVILEIKAQEDIGLPIQALDYYVRVRMHLLRGDFATSSVFRSEATSGRAPRLLLVAPALCFHPTNETVLRFFESSIAVRQIGVALEWRRKLRVMFDHGRTPGAAVDRGRRRDDWQAISSIKSERPFPR